MLKEGYKTNFAILNVVGYRYASYLKKIVYLRLSIGRRPTAAPGATNNTTVTSPMDTAPSLSSSMSKKEDISRNSSRF